MSSGWRRPVSATLRDTEATLHRLQERHDSYVIAKQRAFPGEDVSAVSRRLSQLKKWDGDMYGPYETRNSNGFLSNGGATATRYDDFSTDVEAPPPPLPQQRSSAAFYSEGYMTGNGGSSSNINKQLHLNEGPAMGIEIAALKDVLQGQHVTDSQLKNIHIELELERAVRADAIRDVSQRLHNHVAEMRSAIQRTTEDQNSIQSAVRALETQRAFDGRSLLATAAGGNTSRWADETSAHTMASTLMAAGSPGATTLGPVSSGEVDDTLANAGATARGIGRRVDDLEQDVARHQRVAEERHARTVARLTDMVKTAVQVEAEHMRAVAREAATSSAEGIIKIRLENMQSIFNREIREVMDTSGVSREVAETTERAFQKRAREWTAKLDAFETDLVQLREMEEKQSRDYSQAMSAQANNMQSALQLESGALKNEIQDSQIRQAQSIAAKMDAMRAETIAAAAEMVEERLRSRQAGHESDVLRVVEEAIRPLRAELARTQQDLRASQESAEARQRRMDEMVASLEKSLAEQAVAHAASIKEALKAAEKEHEARLARVTQDMAAQLRSMRSDTESAHTSAAEAYKEATAAASTSREAVAAVESHVKGMKDVHTAQATLVREVAAAKQNHEERLGALETTAMEMKASVPRALAPITASIELLKTTLNGECVDRLDKLEQRIAQHADSIVQLQGSTEHRDSVTAQQLKDARRAAETLVREAEGRLREATDEYTSEAAAARDASERRATRMEERLSKIQVTSAESQAAFDERLAQVEATVSALGSRVASVAAVNPVRTPSIADTASATGGVGGVVPSPELSTRVEELTVSLAALQQAHTTETARTAARLTATATTLTSLSDERVPELEERVAAIAMQVSSVASDAQSLKSRLEKELSHLLQQQQHAEARVAEQTTHLSARLESHAETTSGQLQSAVERMKDFVAPLRLANALTAQDLALEQIAAALHPHLLPPTCTTEALSQLRVAVKALEDSVSASKAKYDAVADRVSALAANESNNPAVNALSERVAALEVQQQQQQQHDKGASPALDDATITPSTLSFNTCVEPRLSTLEERVVSLSTAHRAAQQSATERLSDSLAALHSEVDSSLNPLRLKLRGMEERSEEQSNDVMALQRQLSNFKKEQLENHREVLAEATAHSDAACGALRQEMEVEMKAFVDTQADRKNCTASAVKASRQEQSDDGEEITSSLIKRLAALEARTEALESGGEENLRSTADALSGLRDNLQQCVERVKTELAQQRHDTNGGEASGVANVSAAKPTESSKNTEKTSAVPELAALDDVFVFFFRELAMVQTAVGTLQRSAIEALEMVEEHELDLAILSKVQVAVQQLAHALHPVAETLGVNASLLDVDVGLVEESSTSSSEDANE